MPEIRSAAKIVVNAYDIRCQNIRQTAASAPGHGEDRRCWRRLLAGRAVGVDHLEAEVGHQGVRQLHRPVGLLPLILSSCAFATDPPITHLSTEAYLTTESHCIIHHHNNIINNYPHLTMI